MTTLTMHDKMVLRSMLAIACKHDAANTAEFERVLAKIVPRGPVGRNHFEEAKVDLGPEHNGRVAWRKVFKSAGGTDYIVDKGRHVPVKRVGYGSHAHIHYVTVPR